MNAIQIILVVIAFGLPIGVSLVMWFRAKHETREADEALRKLSR